MILFATQDHADEQGNTPIVNTSDQPWRSQLTEMEYAAVQEVNNHHEVNTVLVEGRDPEGFLVITFTPHLWAASSMPYTTLYVTKEGKVGAADTNRPVYHRTFREMVEDTRFAASVTPSEAAMDAATAKQDQE